MKNINVDDIDIHAVNSHNYMDNTPKNTNYIIENEKIKLNHYPTQSLDFFKKVKMTRGDACYTNNARDIDYFNEYNKNTNVEDTELKDLLTL
jgi:hypothetical protein